MLQTSWWRPDSNRRMVGKDAIPSWNRIDLIVWLDKAIWPQTERQKGSYCWQLTLPTCTMTGDQSVHRYIIIIGTRLDVWSRLGKHVGDLVMWRRVEVTRACKWLCIRKKADNSHQWNDEPHHGAPNTSSHFSDWDLMLWSYMGGVNSASWNKDGSSIVELCHDDKPCPWADCAQSLQCGRQNAGLGTALASCSAINTWPSCE